MEFGKNWKREDSELFSLALAGVYADIQTTKDAIKRGAVEANPLIGENPSGQDLDRAALLGAGLVGAAGMFSDQKERKEILGMLAGLRFGVANQNAHTSAKHGKKSSLELMKQPVMMAALGALMGHMMDDKDSGVSVSMKKGEKSPVEMLLTYRKDF